MAINFPNSPVVNDEYSSGGKTWIYTSAGVWIIKIVAANGNITLGTDTNGRYVGNVQAGTGIVITDNDSSENAAPTVSLASSGVGVGTYGNSTSVGQITVDSFGRITSASNTFITPTWESISNKPDPQITVTLTGDVSGTASAILQDVTSNTISVSTSIGANSVELAVDTFGRYVGNVQAGTGIVITGNDSSENASPTISTVQNIATTANVTFNSLTTTGNVIMGDSIIQLGFGNPGDGYDIGFVGHYFDGSQKHTGLIRDATDGRFKIFSGYTGEPGATTINTSDPSFTLDTIQASEFVGNLLGTADFVSWTGVTDKPDPEVTVTLSGDVTGTASAILTDVTSNTITVTTSIAANSVELGVDTFGRYLGNVQAGTGIVISGNDSSENAAPTISLSTTGVSPGSYGNSITVGQITVDANGRITSASNVAITYPAQDWSVITGKPDPEITVTLAGDITGTGSAILTDVTSNTITITTAVGANSIELGVDTFGRYVGNVQAGDGITITGNDSSENAAPTFALTPSGVSATTYGNNTHFPTVTVDTYGRITSASTIDGHKEARLAVGEITRDMNGFPSRTTSGLTFNESTRVFTIYPVGGTTWSVYSRGNLITITGNLDYTIPTSNGGKYVKFDPTTLTLADGGTFANFRDDITVAYTFWDNVRGNLVILGDERHGSSRDTEWHYNQHRNLGTVWRSGGALTYTLNDPSNVTISVGTPLVIADEDLEHTITHSATPSSEFQQILSGNASLEVIYLLESAYGRYEANTEPWVKGTTNTARYNPVTNSLGSFADAAENTFITYWLLATHDVRRPVKLIMGRQEHANVDAAYSEEFLGYGVAFSEYVFMYQIVLKTSATYNNKANVIIAAVRRIEERLPSATATYSAQQHDLLTGRSSPDQHPIAAITDLQSTLDNKTNVGHTHTAANLVGMFVANVLPGTGINVTNNPGNACANVVVSLTNTGVSATTYGNAKIVPIVTIDAQGRITSASNVDILYPAQDWSVITNKPDPQITVTLTGDVSGTASAILQDVTSNTISITTAIGANTVELAVDTFGRYVGNVQAGSGISITGNDSSENAAPTIALTASGVSASTYGNTYIIPTLTIDTFGRVTAASNNTILGTGARANITVGTTAPSNPVVGDLWVDTN